LLRKSLKTATRSSVWAHRRPFYLKTQTPAWDRRGSKQSGGKTERGSLATQRFSAKPLVGGSMLPHKKRKSLLACKGPGREAYGGNAKGAGDFMGSRKGAEKKRGKSKKIAETFQNFRPNSRGGCRGRKAGKHSLRGRQKCVRKGGGKEK